MSKREFIFSMILGIVLSIICWISAFIGLLMPNTTTPWFWTLGGFIFTVATGLELIRYRMLKN